MQGALALLVLLAGCAGPTAPPPDDSFVGDVEQQIDDDVAGANGTGAIRGTIRNGAGAALADAHVIIIGQPHTTRSGPGGAFELLEVPAGTQRLRFDRVGYLSLERDVAVVDGKATRLNVTLAGDVVGGPGFVEHLHDRWRGNTQLTIFEGVVRHQHAYPPGGSNAAPCTKEGAATVSSANCYTIPLVPEPGTIIPPGTERLEVWVDWQKRDFVKAVTLLYQPANETDMRASAAIEPGETADIAVRYPMTDHGHQAETAWMMLLSAEPRIGSAAFSSQYFNEQFVGDFEVRITAFKGEVPPEAPHPRYWADGPEVVVLDNLTRTLVGLPRTRDPSVAVCSNSAACFLLPPPAVVPSGTTRMQVTLEYQATTPAMEPTMSRKTLAFRTAAVAPGAATLDDLRVEAPTRIEFGRTEYEFVLEEGETDPFYQARSGWMLLLANEGQERGERFVEDCYHYAAGCGGSTYTIRMVAINDNWTPDLAGIREA